MQQNPVSGRSNEIVREKLASILLYHITDPRLAFVTIQSVEVSRDRSVARIYVTAERGHYDEAAEGLESAKGRMRSLLGTDLGWRVTPELRFHIDTSLDEAERIAAILKESPFAKGNKTDDKEEQANDGAAPVIAVKAAKAAEEAEGPGRGTEDIAGHLGNEASKERE